MGSNLKLSAVVFILFFSVSWMTRAEHLHLPKGSYLVAQAEGDDAFDPFSDYSEFDDAGDEESDIYFFKNGRFLTVSFQGGMRGYTDNLANLYSTAPTYGLALSYFFDMRFALEFAFKTSDHNYHLATPTATMDGNVSMTFMSLNLKYFFNTQNLMKGLADLNPFIIGGFSQVYRTISVNNVDGGYSRDGALGVDMGAGIEIPIMRKKAFFGIEGLYHMVGFKDKNQALIIPSGNTTLTTNVKPSGDSYDVLFMLGLNF